MSRLVETVTTLTIAGEEQDVRIRAHVAVEYGSLGSEASIDGDIHAHVIVAPATVLAWVDVDYLELDAGDRERAVEALETEALEDDRDADYRPRPSFGREGARYAR